MGRGVEKARVALASAENGADKIERRLSGSGGAAALGVLERAPQLLVASDGAGWRIDRAFACGMQRFDGGSERGFPFPSVVACGSSMADGTGGINAGHDGDLPIEVAVKSVTICGSTGKRVEKRGFTASNPHDAHALVVASGTFPYCSTGSMR
jgi:hypothetical protein